MKPITRKLIPLAVLLTFIGIAYVITSNPPESKRSKPSSKPQLVVEAQTIAKRDIALNLSSYGTVKPRTQSMLLPQVAGQINHISANFREGGFFEKGEVLVEIDSRDYQVEIKIAQASLFSAKQALSEEQARVEQALQDWQRLGNSEQAPDLVLRKPQLLAAQANVLSAEASLSKAELALERTKIVAPFSGRILTKFVDVGQVVSSNTQLAEIYAIDYVEVRLPIKNNDLPFINLPENNRYNSELVSEQPEVIINSDISVKQQWRGKIVRTEGAFDQNSQQLFVVAHIDDPYGINNDSVLPIKIGQYVSAKITGKPLQQVLIIPNKAIYQGSYVYLVKNNTLLRQEITIAWQNDSFALIKSGLNEGEKLVLTPLGQVNSGTIVSISKLDGEPVKLKENNKKRNEKRAAKRGES